MCDSVRLLFFFFFCRACRNAGAKRGPRRDGATRLIESRIVLELQSARGIRSAYGSIGT